MPDCIFVHMFLKNEGAQEGRLNPRDLQSWYFYGTVCCTCRRDIFFVKTAAI